MRDRSAKAKMKAKKTSAQWRQRRTNVALTKIWRKYEEMARKAMRSEMAA